MPKSKHIFISYSHIDGRKFCHEISNQLEVHGHQVWYDEHNLDPYLDFSMMIEHAIEESSHVVVCLTPDVASREDSFVRREIVYAQQRRKPIIPLLCKGFDKDKVPILICHLTWISYETDTALLTLLERLKHDRKFIPPKKSVDPFHNYLQQLLKFTVNELNDSPLIPEASVTLRLEDKDGKTRPAHLPVAFQSRSLKLNRSARIFDNLDQSFTAHGQRILLLGEPGSGKTTSLLTFAREKAYARLANPAELLPLYAPFSSWDKQSELMDWLSNALDIDTKLLREELEDKRVILILDGLDELGGDLANQIALAHQQTDNRIKALDMLDALNIFIVISCRSKDYDDILKLRSKKPALNGAVELIPLSDEQIKQYLSTQPDLVESIMRDAALLEIARIPLILNLLAHSWQDVTQELEETSHSFQDMGADLKDQIIFKFVRLRFEHELKRSQVKDDLDFLDMYELLGEQVVFEMGRPSLLTQSNGTTFHASSNQIDSYKRISKLHLIRFESDDKYRFSHLMFRDHFAMWYVWHLANRPDSLNSIKDDKLTDADSTSNQHSSYSDSLRKPLLRLGMYTLFTLRNEFAVGILIEAAKSNDIYVRLHACQVLAFASPEPYLHMLSNDLLHHPDASVRREIADNFGLLAAKYPSTVTNILTQALRDEDVGVRYYVAHDLAAFPHKSAVLPLIDALSDTDEDVRWEAAQALRYIGDKRAVKALCDALSHPDEDFRATAADVLGDLRSKRAIKPLIHALKDSSAEVRGCAARSLGKIGDERAVNDLIGLLIDEEYVFDYTDRVCDVVADALLAIATDDALTAVFEWETTEVGIRRGIVDD